jgi:hypothetical protein
MVMSFADAEREARKACSSMVVNGDTLAQVMHERESDYQGQDSTLFDEMLSVPEVVFTRVTPS